jgi:hypothetical protein
MPRLVSIRRRPDDREDRDDRDKIESYAMTTPLRRHQRGQRFYAPAAAIAHPRLHRLAITATAIVVVALLIGAMAHRDVGTHGSRNHGATQAG